MFSLFLKFYVYSFHRFISAFAGINSSYFQKVYTGILVSVFVWNVLLENVLVSSLDFKFDWINKSMFRIISLKMQSILFHCFITVVLMLINLTAIFLAITWYFYMLFPGSFSDFYFVLGFVRFYHVIFRCVCVCVFCVSWCEPPGNVCVVLLQKYIFY